ncbi:MAG: hypothetical protein PF904_06355 [Kiritimatiellae bacterium]|jgi:hypothetical protein|nr:hypothetical protein [Kiritimatiellia bacterium]
MNQIKTVTLISLAVVALTLTNTSCKKEGAEGNESSKEAQSSQFTTEFETIKGKWLRPDGGYVIEFRELLPDNQLSVGYFNPNPINVGEAKIYKENDFLKVFVKLQDRNYPGSTYTLIYDKASDQLRGIYFQAVQGTEFEVSFTRMPRG